MEVQIKILNKEFYKQGFQSTGNEDLIPYWDNMPDYATEGSAAIDLILTRDIILLPNCTVLQGTGLAIHIKDPNVAAFLLPRSGLGHKEGLVLGNLTGLLDADYQGELKISLWNRSEVVRYYSKGDRIAQLIFIPIVRPKFKVVEEFTDLNNRGGFGSTGGVK